MNRLTVLAVLALTGSFGSAFAEVKVEIVAYHGWTGCYRVSNGTVDLVVVPSIGRVMRYGFVGRDNMLWENAALAGKPAVGPDWNNYGGDKMWPAPQSDWGWPPDPELDGTPWTAEALPNGVRITSPASKRSQVQFVRDITLADLGTEVRFHSLMKNEGKRRLMSAWQITQVDDPYSVYLPFLPTSQMPSGWRLLTGSHLDPTAHHLLTDGLQISRANVSYKFGSFAASGEITSSKGTTVFHTQTKTYDRADYPDGGSALEVYMNAGSDKYAELELLGAMTRMENGEASVLDTTWHLTQGRFL